MRPSKKRAHASLSESQEVNSNSNSSGDDERCAKRRNTKEDQTARSSGGNRPSRSLTTDCDNGEAATHNQHQQQSQVDSTTYYSCNDNSDADDANAAAVTRVSLSPPGQRNESIGSNREQLQQFTELRQRQRAEAASLLNNNNSASSAGSLPVSTGSQNSTNNNQRNERSSRHVVHQPQLQSRQRGLSTTLFMLLNRAILFLVWSLFVTKFGSSILATTDIVKQHPDTVFNSSIVNYPSEEDHCNILESELSSRIEEMERRALVSKMQYQSKIDQLERQVVMEQNNCFSDQKRLHETQSKLEELVSSRIEEMERRALVSKMQCESNIDKLERQVIMERNHCFSDQQRLHETQSKLEELERLTNVKQALDQQEEQEKLLDQIEQLKKDLAFTISQCVAV